LENCYLCRTDPADVARVESKTFIVTPDRFEAVPHVATGCKGILGQWMSPESMDIELQTRLPGSMKVAFGNFCCSYKCTSQMFNITLDIHNLNCEQLCYIKGNTFYETVKIKLHKDTAKYRNFLVII